MPVKRKSSRNGPKLSRNVKITQKRSKRASQKKRGRSGRKSRGRKSQRGGEACKKLSWKANWNHPLPPQAGQPDKKAKSDMIDKFLDPENHKSRYKIIKDYIRNKWFRDIEANYNSIDNFVTSPPSPHHHPETLDQYIKRKVDNHTKTGDIGPINNMFDWGHTLWKYAC